MKKIFSFLVLVSMSYATYAQQLKLSPVVKSKRFSYKIDTTTLNRRLTAENEKNVLKYRRSGVKGDIAFEKKDNFSTSNAFLKVFDAERLKQLLPENNMLINYYVLPSGQIKEVSFILNKNTVITPAELEALEIEIKDKVSFKLNPADVQNTEFIPFVQIIRFSSLLKNDKF